jgi:hypothetical protein
MVTMTGSHSFASVEEVGFEDDVFEECEIKKGQSYVL